MNRKAKLAAGIVIAAVILVLGITLGVTVSLSKADAQPIIVTDEQSLVEAFSARRDKTIVLGCDITVSGDLELAHMNDFDLYGSTLTVNGDIRIGDDADDGEYFFGGDGDAEDGMDEGTIVAENIIVNAPNAHIEWYERVSAKKLDVKTASNSFVFNGTFVSSDGRPASDADITLSGGKLIVGSAASNVTYRVSIPATADGAGVVSVYNETTGENVVVDIVTAKSVTVGGSVKVTAEADATDVTVNTEESAEVVLVGGTFAGVEGSASSVTVNAGATVSGNVVVGGNVTVNGSVTGEVQKVIEISTAAEFLALDDLADEMVGGKQYYVELNDDIDLSDTAESEFKFISGIGSVAVTRFYGIFDGNGHKITGNNALAYLFGYAYNSAEFKELTVEFDSEEITRVVASAEYTATSISPFKTDTERIDLKYTDVDFIAPGTNYYNIGDIGNVALYYNNNCTVIYAYYNGNDYDTYNDSTTVNSTGKCIDFAITLSGCNVDGNYTGGNHGSGAAIFFGGQIYLTIIDISDSSFDGVLVGRNAGVIFANSSGVVQGLSDGEFNKNFTLSGVNVTPRINVENVALNGTLITFSNDSGITFGNNASNCNGIEGTENVNIRVDATLAVKAENGQFLVRPATTEDDASYRLQLKLGSLLWYYDEEMTTQSAVTSDYTVTIELPYSLGLSDASADEYIATGIYKAYPRTLQEVQDNADFATALDGATWSVSLEGRRYAFVEVSGIRYIVIDPGEGAYRAFSSSAKNELLSADVFVYDSANAAVAAGTATA